MPLDDSFKHLIQELGEAINDALTESARINDAIQNMKNSGYDVFLVLEVTIGFNKRASTEQLAPVTDPAVNLTGYTGEAGDAPLKVTAQDLKFLRSLKISVEDLDE